MKFNPQLMKLSNRRSALICKIMDGDKLNISEENELKTINTKIAGILRKDGVKFPHDR